MLYSIELQAYVEPYAGHDPAPTAWKAVMLPITPVGLMVLTAGFEPAIFSVKTR